MEQLSRLGAPPQVLRFRFERGARIKSPADVVKRAEPLLGPKGPGSWTLFSLSGTPVTQSDAPASDLIGTPRRAWTSWRMSRAMKRHLMPA